jgi:hypothetical protein
MRTPFVIACTIALLAPQATPAAAQATPPSVQAFPLSDTKVLVEHNVKVDAVEYLGRKAARVTTTGKGAGYAFVSGVDFQDGTIEADIVVKVTRLQGAPLPGFIGIAFRSRTDASHYDLFYIRPGNSRADDQAIRNHSAQYCAAPGYGWYELRRAWPWVYEAYTDVATDTWTHIKIEVAGRTAKLYLNGSARPTLVVDGLKGEDLRGAIALQSFNGEESYFSNLRITHAPPQPVKNGSEAAGIWDVKLESDTGMYDGTMQLRRDGTALSGVWSGALGQDRPVTGTWREGYVELTFGGEWPKGGDGAPGAVTATLAGWIDGVSGKGRAKVEGRTDGVWTATRKAQ